MNKITLHVIAPFHTSPNHTYDTCPYTGKALRFSEMMQSQGYNVIEYANEGSISTADEKVTILTANRLLQYTSEVAHFTDLLKIGNGISAEFKSVLDVELKKRVKPNDIICHVFGDSFKHLVADFPSAIHIETGIGYDGLSFGAFRVYESYAWMHYSQAKEDVLKNTGSRTNFDRRGKMYNYVAPNYYNISDWEPSYDEGKYILFVGRITEDKGLMVLRRIASKIKEPIHVYGHTYGNIRIDKVPNIIYHGVINGKKERSDLFRNAKVIIVPSLYVEPFAGVHVEAMLCGTPVLASPFGVFTETIEVGKTGFLCHTLGDYLHGLEAVKKLDRKYISDRARERWSLDTVGRLYDSIFKDVIDNKTYGWDAEHSNRI